MKREASLVVRRRTAVVRRRSHVVDAASHDIRHTTYDIRPVSVGIGYDAHRFVEGRRLWLGGVEIPHSRGLDGHSDADALLHAICDALLGAAGLGDIGRHFPSSDPLLKGIASTELLRRTCRLVHHAGYGVSNIDAVVIAEEPRLGPFQERMRAVIATAAGVAAPTVNVKVTSNERMGAIGRGEGIAAHAVALLVQEQVASDKLRATRHRLRKTKREA